MTRKCPLLALFIACFTLIGHGWAAPMNVKAKGTMEFISDAPMEKIVGNAEGSGTLIIDTADLSKLTGQITVPVAGMKTGNDRRDEHLRSAEWLDAPTNPNITFAVKSVTPLGAPTVTGPVSSADVTVVGELNIHGVAKPLSTKATIKWKENKFKVTTTFSIALADYEVKGASGIVGSKVGKTISIKVRLVGQGI